MSERLQIYQITTLEEMLKNVLGKLIEHAPLAKPPRFNPLINVLNQVIAHGCKVVIKQYPVQDPDFFAEYNAYYSRIFANVDKYCERLHFFSLPLTDQNETALDYIDRVAAIPNSYIGFSTIRPVRSSPIGATILRPPKGSHFVLCRDVFPVHLAGQTFSVTGTPFMQQDNAVGACAQTSIWMALRTLRKKEGNSAFDPAQITNAATRFLIGGRTLPNREGLQINQMIEAIRNAGYSTHVCTFRSSGEVMSNPLLQSVKRTLYTYVESEIPVILALYPESGDGHAVVLIGHGWGANIINRVDVDIPLSANNATQVCHAVSWVNHFYIHNDNTGPYQTFPERKEAGANYFLEDVALAIPLLPGDVYVSGEEADTTSRELLGKILQLFEAMGSQVNLNDFLNQVVIRTYLIDKHKFREWARNSGMTKELKEYYRIKSLPRRVWITEISLFLNYGEADIGKAQRIGEILVDPTGDPNDGPFLSIHLNMNAFSVDDFMERGILVDRDPNTGDIELRGLSSDVPYGPLTRCSVG